MTDLISDMFNHRLAKFWSDLSASALELHAIKLKTVTESAIAQINQGDLARWVDAEYCPNV